MQFKNYLLNADYKLDNNKIEQVKLYISLSRRNSLFFGSHAGAKQSALLFSLASSCRLHGINTFDYLSDFLSRMPDVKYDLNNSHRISRPLHETLQKHENEEYGFILKLPKKNCLSL